MQQLVCKDFYKSVSTFISSLANQSDPCKPARRSGLLPVP